MAPEPPPAPGWRRRLVFAAFVVVLSVAALEGVLVALRRLPALSMAPPVAALARELYQLDRPIVQYEPEMARWDPELGYTLRPGSFRFSATEFDTAFEVNRVGLRDDEASLAAPEIVVLGDSFAMGWGVEQAETFADRLEAATGRRVLNGGMSSWGTGRELRLLAGLDLSRAAWVVLQFGANDWQENRIFVHGGDEVRPQGEAAYGETVRSYLAGRRYWPGRYAGTLLGRRLGLLREDGGQLPDFDDPAFRHEQVAQLLELLRRADTHLAGRRLVVLELNPHNRQSGWFIPLLRDTLAARPDLPPAVRSLVALDIAPHLGPEHFYRLDDHLRPSGHAVVAELLTAVVAATD